ncbi:hypothetical protein B0H19DRAFT_1077058 [Mycena capillaripes]|nr:hypothetical protein B0H19DRAFT_1077058 [Mycena capillaripes]
MSTDLTTYYTNTQLNVGLIWWLLAQEVLRLQCAIPHMSDGWSVMVDMFFCCDPEEAEKQQKEEAVTKAALLYGAEEPAQVAEWDVGGAAPDAINHGLFSDIGEAFPLDSFLVCTLDSAADRTLVMPPPTRPQSPLLPRLAGTLVPAAVDGA